MLKNCSIFITLIFNIFIISQDSFSQDYTQDSIAVRAILDSNGLNYLSVEQVADSSGGRILKLRIENEGLSIIPSEIGLLTELKYLYLGYNRSLKELPHEIENLTKLEYFNCIACSFTSIPSEILNLITLNYLSFHSNSISNIPIEIGNLINLDTLYFRDNSLTDIPSTIGNLSSLIYLELLMVALYR